MRRPDHLFSFFSARGAALSLALHARRAVLSPLAYARTASRLLRGGKGGALRFLRFPVDAATVAASPLFDAAAFSRARPALAGRDPALAFLLAPWQDDPALGVASESFSCRDYVAQNPEIATCGVHPLVHYEQYGRFTGLCVSKEAAAAREAPPPFPAEAAECDIAVRDRFPARTGRIAFFATYAPGGVVQAHDFPFLAALREECDAVVFVASGPVLPSETDKLRPLADRIVCRAHGGYDFGSWRIALALAREAGWLAADKCSELLFVNDSCYAPVRPLRGMFVEMERRECAFWGVTENPQLTPKPHLQSYFLAFRRPVLDSSALEDFFAARPARVNRADAVRLYEMQLTEFLEARGFRHDSFAKTASSRRFPANPTTRPIALLRRWRVPLVKTKVFRGETSDPPARVLECVRALNPDLASLVRISPPPGP